MRPQLAFIILRWVIPVVLSNYKYVRNNIFVYSHKTQLCTIKYVLLYLLRHVLAFNGHYQVVYENL